MGGINLLFCSHSNGTVVFNVGNFRPRWQYFNLFNPTFQTHKEKNMNIIFAVLLVIAIVVFAAFLAGFVMVAREHMAIDERLHRYTH